MVADPEVADSDFVSWLLDTERVGGVGDEVSTIAAAIREARQLTGRDPATGIERPSNRHRSTWAGALVWFIVLEQLATCFRPTRVVDGGVGKIALALVWFGQVDRTKAVELDRLRDRFAHDYSLEHPNGTRYRLTGEADAPLLKQRNRRPEVSLYELAETAELAVRTVRALADSGELRIQIEGGEDTIRRRFSMVLEDDDVVTRND